MGRVVSGNVQDAFYRVVHDYPEGVEALANKMGLHPGTLYNKANMTESSHNKPSLADAVLVTVITGDKRILRAFAATAGEMCYAAPDLADLSEAALAAHITRIGMEGGDFYGAIHSALSHHDALSIEACHRIEHEAHEWIAAILEGLERLKGMAREGSR